MWLGPEFKVRSSATLLAPVSQIAITMNLRRTDWISPTERDRYLQATCGFHFGQTLAS